MKTTQLRTGLVMAALLAPASTWAHVTLQTSQPLRVGANYANVVLNVPNEKNINNTKVTLEVPDAFLRAGGRVNRVNFPPGWTVTIEKQDKPADVIAQEKAQRSKRDSQKQASAGSSNQGAPAGAGAPGDQQAATGEGHRGHRGSGNDQDREAAQDSRNKWITKVTFEASGENAGIPPDGFEQFLISFQLPKDPGHYRFPAVQTYADGQEVSWSELVAGAENPAPTLAVLGPESWISYSNLPILLAALSLLVSCCALILAVPFRKKAIASSRSAAGQLASARA